MLQPKSKRSKKRQYNAIAVKLLMPAFPTEIEYSDKYKDEDFEYRHVKIPKGVYMKMPKGRLMNEKEWRSLGIQQSLGWAHYEVYTPEPYVLLFRRKPTSAPANNK